jgi:hypothetical protein
VDVDARYAFALTRDEQRLSFCLDLTRLAQSDADALAVDPDPVGTLRARTLDLLETVCGIVADESFWSALLDPTATERADEAVERLDPAVLFWTLQILRQNRREVDRIRQLTLDTVATARAQARLDPDRRRRDGLRAHGGLVDDCALLSSDVDAGDIETLPRHAQELVSMSRWLIPRVAAKGSAALVRMFWGVPADDPRVDGFAQCGPTLAAASLVDRKGGVERRRPRTACLTGRVLADRLRPHLDAVATELSRPYAVIGTTLGSTGTARAERHLRRLNELLVDHGVAPDEMTALVDDLWHALRSMAGHAPGTVGAATEAAQTALRNMEAWLARDAAGTAPVSR